MNAPLTFSHAIVAEYLVISRFLAATSKELYLFLLVDLSICIWFYILSENLADSI
jgi:hypothetical protein